MDKFKTLEEVVKQPDDTVFMDWDFDKANSSQGKSKDISSPLDAFFSENKMEGRYYFTVGDIKSIARKFDDDEKIVKLLADQKKGFEYLDNNKPAEYHTSAEIRNEYDEEYFDYRRPIIDHILSKCDFEVNSSNYFIYVMVAYGVIQILISRNPNGHSFY